jgi:predicted TIM-barrel fold metal-dependent hydrolase
MTRRIVDGHVHVWPDAIAARALGHPSPELPRFGDGTVASLLRTMNGAGIDRAACLAVADTPERVVAANDFVGSLDPARFVSIGTVHPGLSVGENRASLQASGARAVKLHPLFQGYSLDDERLQPLLDSLQGELPVIAHVGDGGEAQVGSGCTPEMLLEIVERFPRLDIVACHFGGYRRLDDAERLLVGRSIYLDTSWPPGLASLDPDRVRSIVDRHGPERIIFGSDWPMADPAAEVEAVVSLGYSTAETDAMLGGTLSRLLRIDG